jgi:hypothetical protein
MGSMKKTDPNQNFRTFYRALPAALKPRFAEEAGTTTGYIEAHLVYARKFPRKGTFDKLWKACATYGAAFSRQDLQSFFFDGGNTLH